MNRIISKEEEREDIQGEILQSIFEYSGVSTDNTRTTRFLRIQCILQCFHTQSSNSAYRINSSTRNTTTTRLIPCHPVQTSTRHLPVTVPRVSKHSTRQNKAPGFPTVFQGSIQHKQASSNSTRKKQHSRRQAASTQSLQQFPGQVLHYRILPGFIPKGLSIVHPCNTKVSVFQFTYSYFRIILQEN